MCYCELLSYYLLVNVKIFLGPMILPNIINSLRLETKVAEIVNSVDLDEVAHNEPPQLDLHCLPSSL